MTKACSFVAVLAVVLAAVPARGETVTDAKHGFTFEVPDGFVAAPPTGVAGELYAFRSPTGLIVFRSVDVAAPPTATGGTRSTRRWEGQGVDVYATTVQSGGAAMTARVAQLPMAGRGVEVTVAEAADHAGSIDNELAGVLNDIDLVGGGGSGSTPTAPPSSVIQSQATPSSAEPPAPAPTMVDEQLWPQMLLAVCLWGPVVVARVNPGRRRPASAPPATLANSAGVRRRWAARLAVFIGVGAFVVSLGLLLAAVAAGAGRLRQFSANYVGGVIVVAPVLWSGFAALASMWVARLVNRLRLGPVKADPPRFAVAAATPDFSGLGDGQS